jgi:hypothetical protein
MFSKVERLGASRGPLLHVNWLKGFDTLINGSGTELVSGNINNDTVLSFVNSPDNKQVIFTLK